MDINSAEIIRILEDWNLWKRDIETGYLRDFYVNKLKKMLDSGQVLVITGPRRSGKTYIMRQLASILVKNGVSRNRILFINFEDPRLPELDARILQKIYEAYLEYLSPEDEPFLFLDEIQEVKNWEKWVLSIHELKKAYVILSGSNAKLLSRELATLLTGRHLDINVFPLSFKEFLKFRGIELKDGLDLMSNEVKIRSLLREYMEFGGFPEVVLRENKKELVLNYFKDIVEKDLVRRYNIRKVEEMKSLLRFYTSNVSSLVTFSSMEKFLRIRKDTVEKFSGYFENVFLIFFLKRFSFKVKEQEKSPRKVYAVDPALPNVIGFRFSENVGRIAENVVFLELLRKKFQNPDMEIFYWKDEKHREVDFVVKKGQAVEFLIQVCWNLAHPKTKEREIKSLIKAGEELRCNNLIVINAELKREEEINGKKIRFMPLWEWIGVNSK